MATKYNFSPQPRAGSFTKEYGGVPGSIDAPDPFADLAALYPNLSQTNDQVSRNIMASLRGELSPETLAGIQNDAAAYGVTSGMPGSDLSFRRGITQKAGTREALQQQGLQQFLASLAGISKTQALDPAMQAEIADRNANYNAAPDPRANALQIQRTFDQNRGGMNGGGGVTYSQSGRGGGGVGAPGLPPGQNDFWSGPTQGTGWEAPTYTGGWQSPLSGMDGFSFGNGGSQGGLNYYDPFAIQQGGEIDFGTPGGAGGDGAAGAPFGGNQYDPLAEYGFGDSIDYGLGESFDAFGDY